MESWLQMLEGIGSIVSVRVVRTGNWSEIGSDLYSEETERGSSN